MLSWALLFPASDAELHVGGARRGAMPFVFYLAAKESVVKEDKRPHLRYYAKIGLQWLVEIRNGRRRLTRRSASRDLSYINCCGVSMLMCA